MERARPGLKKILADSLKRSAPEEAPILAWPLVCGPAVAGKTRAVGFVAGILQVETEDETWRKQLVDFAPSYLAALNQMVSERVQRIEFTVARPPRSQ